MASSDRDQSTHSLTSPQSSRLERTMHELAIAVARLETTVASEGRATREQLVEVRKWVSKLDAVTDEHSQRLTRLEIGKPDRSDIAATNANVVVLSTNMAWLLGGVAAIASAAGIVVSVTSLVIRIAGGV